MRELWNDLRYAARTLGRSPGFTAAAALTLALGIGANAAVWSVVHAVLLRPLPYPHPEQLVMLWETAPQVPRDSFSGPDFLDYRERLAGPDGRRPFTGLAAFVASGVQLDGENGPERIRGCTATEGFFQILGARPTLGRTFLAEDHRLGAAPVIVLTDGFWRRRFGADPRIVGRSLPINGRSVTVVGVLPPGFRFSIPGFLRPVEVWTPLALSPGGDRGGHSLRVLGRLATGVTPGAVQSELAATAALLARQYPATNDGVGTRLIPLHEQIAGPSRRALLVLLSAVGLVLLTACANVANLLLARAASRRREIAVRRALGAGRLRLLSQLLAESLLLAALGGGLGLLFASWGLDLLVPLGGAELPRVDEIRFDGATVAFTASAVLLTALLFGLAPALSAARQAPGEGLRDGERGGSGVGRRRARGALAIAEVALALVLSTGAGLLIRSFLGLLDTRPGFEPRGVLTATVVLPKWKYREGPAQAAALEQLVARVAALPGVRAAGAIDDLPLDGDRDANTYLVSGKTLDPKTLPDAEVRSITPAYLTAMRIPLAAGRAFTAADSAKAPPVAIVNRALARRSFPGVDPVGKRLSFDGKRWLEIVGVSGDVRDLSLDAPAEAEIYLPNAQTPGLRATLVLAGGKEGAGANAGNAGNVGNAGVSGLVAAVRQAARSVDRDLVVTRAEPMTAVIGEALAERRFHVLLLGLFAAAAFALAALGVYGVISSGVAERTREIGIRVALGAGRGDVLRMVLGQGATLAAAGVAIGTALALGLTQLLTGLLYGVGAADPGTFAAAALLLAGVALFASLLPATRAARLDPVIALKEG
jgi:putative ABC transport system permease protein